MITAYEIAITEITSALEHVVKKFLCSFTIYIGQSKLPKLFSPQVQFKYGCSEKRRVTTSAKFEERVVISLDDRNIHSITHYN